MKMTTKKLNSVRSSRSFIKISGNHWLLRIENVAALTLLMLLMLLFSGCGAAAAEGDKTDPGTLLVSPEEAVSSDIVATADVGLSQDDNSSNSLNYSQSLNVQNYPTTPALTPFATTAVIVTFFDLLQSSSCDSFPSGLSGLQEDIQGAQQMAEAVKWAKERTTAEAEEGGGYKLGDLIVENVFLGIFF